MKYAVYLLNLRKDLIKSFTEKNIDINDVDCILMEVLNISFSDLRKDRLLTTSEVNSIMKCVEKRMQGKPVTKIFHKAYFYGYEFYVDENVLSPRSETEILVEHVLNFIDTLHIEKSLRILDLCTGSGAIACAIKKECEKKLRQIDMVATDISENALKVARQNAKVLNCNVNFIKSDMFNNIDGKFDVIISNPPYIESKLCQSLDREVKNYDPILALDGGEDGLDFYRIIQNNLDKLNEKGVLFLEIGYNQATAIEEIFKDYNIKIIKDYLGHDRVVIVKK